MATTTQSIGYLDTVWTITSAPCQWWESKMGYGYTIKVQNPNSFPIVIKDIKVPFYTGNSSNVNGVIGDAGGVSYGNGSYIDIVAKSTSSSPVSYSGSGTITHSSNAIYHGTSSSDNGYFYKPEKPNTDIINTNVSTIIPSNSYVEITITTKATSGTIAVSTGGKSELRIGDLVTAVIDKAYSQIEPPIIQDCAMNGNTMFFNVKTTNSVDNNKIVALHFNIIDDKGVIVKSGRYAPVSDNSAYVIANYTYPIGSKSLRLMVWEEGTSSTSTISSRSFPCLKVGLTKPTLTYDTTYYDAVESKLTLKFSKADSYIFNLSTSTWDKVTSTSYPKGFSELQYEYKVRAYKDGSYYDKVPTVDMEGDRVEDLSKIGELWNPGNPIKFNTGDKLYISTRCKAPVHISKTGDVPSSYVESDYIYGDWTEASPLTVTNFTGKIKVGDTWKPGIWWKKVNGKWVKIKRVYTKVKRGDSTESEWVECR